MKFFLFLILSMFLVSSCGKKESENSRKNDTNISKDRLKNDSVVNTLKKLNGSSVFEVAAELNNLTYNSQNYLKIIKELDSILIINCKLVCTITERR